MPSRTPRLRVVAPSERAHRATQWSSLRAIPCPRCDGATHIPTSSSFDGSPDHPSNPPATPTISPWSLATNHWHVVVRSRQVSSSNWDSRSTLDVKAWGASANERSRTSRMTLQSSGVRRCSSITGGHANWHADDPFRLSVDRRISRRGVGLEARRAPCPGLDGDILVLPRVRPW